MIKLTGDTVTISNRLRDLAGQLEASSHRHRQIHLMIQHHFEEVIVTPVAKDPFFPVDQRFVGLTVIVTSHPELLKVEFKPVPEGWG